MRYRCAKEYLNQIHEVEKTKAMLQQSLDNIRGTLYSIGLSGSPPDVRVQTSPDPDKISNMVSACMEYEERITQKIEHLIQLKIQITTEIQSLPTKKYQRILYYRHVEDKTWNEVLREMYYHYDDPASGKSVMFRTYREACEEFENTFPEKF